ncbi:MAG TPA: four helix bundle protein [Phycisphaerae bacterium]|nr:four helix bundle protein [Phycisphaerae bacterium]HOJ73006.1 four helix bundle protein [Phycisphaerae bacterium]HOM50190.1 four helix bundle protein [Phycisphaerae bacterium]HON67042.1 four helix bundle protein [Phycisphaerae bacterium]HOQ87293.1 four helix bundle protein [Phycisphaerae bacterium]
MQDFRNLKVWQRVHELALGVYKVSRLFPKEEIYGLTSQMRRAAVWGAANLAEGYCRQGDA